MTFDPTFNAFRVPASFGIRTTFLVKKSITAVLFMLHMNVYATHGNQKLELIDLLLQKRHILIKSFREKWKPILHST